MSRVLGEIKNARELVYLPAPAPIRPKLLSRPHFTLSPYDATVSPSEQGTGEVSVYCENPSLHPIIGWSIDWGALLPYVSNRAEVEERFVEQPIPSPNGHCQLLLRIRGTVLADKQSPYRITFRARYEQETISAELLLRFKPLKQKLPPLEVAPTMLNFGSIHRPHQGAELSEMIAQPLRDDGPFLVTLWSPKRGQREYTCLGSEEVLVVKYESGKDAVYYRVGQEGVPRWQRLPLGRMRLTPAGASIEQRRASHIRYLTIRSHCESAHEFHLLRKPSWLTITPECFDLNPGGTKTLKVSIETNTPGAELGRGLHEEEVVIASASGEFTSTISVRANVYAAGPVMEIEPKVLDFGLLRPDERRRIELMITNRGSGTLEVEIGTQTGPVGLVSRRLTNSDSRRDSTAAVTLEFNPDQVDRAGHVEFDIPIRTNSSVLGQTQVSLRGEAFIGQLNCEPPLMTPVLVAYGDRLSLPCHIWRSDYQPVHLSFLGLVFRKPGPWQLAAQMQNESRFDLHIQAPEDPESPSFEGAVQFRDGPSSLSGDLPVVVRLEPASAELSVDLWKSKKSHLKNGVELPAADLRHMKLTILNVGQVRLLVESVLYQRKVGPPMKFGNLPRQPIESRQTFVIPICCPWAVLWKVYKRFELSGTIELRCQYHNKVVASHFIELSVRRKKDSGR